METLIERLDRELKEAMREKNERDLVVLRQLRSALKNEEIRLREVLTAEQVLAVIAREHKKLTDALGDFERAGREDLATPLRDEIALIARYLPAPLSDEELAEIVRRCIEDAKARGAVHQGKLMGDIMKIAKGRADAGRVSALVASLLAA